MHSVNSTEKYDDTAIAIVGMACRFPGAKDIEQFWDNLQNGVESISFFSEAELEAAGIPRNLWQNPKYVKAAPLIPDIDLFDAEFFGYSRREAEMMDPQHRLFLELAWTALENAGYDSERYQGAVGVYGSTWLNAYVMLNQAFPKLDENFLPTVTGSTTDFLTTRVSYKLNLNGPSIAVQTACSSGLVAVHLACQSLLNGECDLALAGGVSLWVLGKKGYRYQEEGILSPDGHCRAFDARAQGTIFGNGVGIVTLKRLADAIADGDTIHTIIKGTAVNNDGALKIGYAATSVDGQAAAIAEAMAMAGVDAETISYVEAHGTGTALGDPIEIAGLTKAFRTSTTQNNFCAIGSVKTNIGHMGVASGIAGLMKTVLALKHQAIPPSLHFDRPNPQIDFANSPFFVNTTLRQWHSNGNPRRAGVSALGIGGTNAHAILEEAPPIPPSTVSRPWQLLLLSAKTATALDRASTNLAQHLKQHPAIALADVAYTYQVGRQEFHHRRMVVCQTVEEAIAALESGEPSMSEARIALTEEPRARAVAFMFSGQGSQYVNMGLDLYQTEPIFRENVDRCCEILKLHLGMDLRHILYPEPERVSIAREQLAQTQFAQPALFAIEYALAQMWMSWGIQPQAAIGHSIGEYVAATLAGVMSLADALMVVAMRGRLMQQLPPGAMLGVGLSASEVALLLEENLSIAAINGRSRCVVSGAIAEIDRLATKLAKKNIDCRRLHTSHAFHSPMMAPIEQEFAVQVAQILLHPPQIPYISNVTGTWITAEEATDPQYWAKHLRQPVQFASGLDTLAQDPDRLLLEVGPGRVLSTLALDHLDRSGDCLVISSLGHPQQQHSDMAIALTALGQLWLAGVTIDWAGFYIRERRHRLPLPTYPFERQRYWLNAPRIPQQEQQGSPGSHFSHPLLGQLLRSPLQQKIYQSELDADSLSFLRDSRLEGEMVLPATAYWEMALAAAQTLGWESSDCLESVTMRQPLILKNETIYLLQTIVNPETSDRHTFEIYSLPEYHGVKPVATSLDGSWTLHATGKICRPPREGTIAPPTLAQVRSRRLEPLALATFAQMLSSWGLDEGNSFGTVKQLWRGDGEVLGQLEFSAAEAGDYQIHPAALEAALRLFVATLPESDNPNDTHIYQPLSLERLQVFAPLTSPFWSYVGQGSLESNAESIVLDVHLFDAGENIIATLEGLHLERIARSALLSSTEDLQNWLYEVKWQKQEPNPEKSSELVSAKLTAPTQIATQLLPEATDALGQTKRNFALFENLEALSIEYVWQALQQLGWDYRPGDCFSTPEIAELFGIVKRHRLLFQRMLEMLQEVGMLKRSEAESHTTPRWKFCQGLDNRDLSLEAATLSQKFPQGTAELTLLEKCGSHLAPVLRGARDPLELLFPEGSSSQVERFYGESPISKAYNTLVRNAVATALEQWPATQKLRVLEIGAGTGSTTAEILSEFPRERTEYVFTDVSPLFLAKASEKFGDRHFLRYQLLDIEKDPTSQGFSAQEFHIIIAANVLHATGNLRTTLHHVRQLLAPEGLLILLEGTKPQRWVDLTFGLTEGWWKFAESDGERSHPLLSASQWLSLLPATGFSEAVTVPDTGERDGLFGEQHMIIAKNAALAPLTVQQGNPWGISGVEPKRWLIFADRGGVGEQLAAELTHQGANCDLVFWGEKYEAIQANRFTIHKGQSQDYQQLWQQLRKISDSNYTGAVHLWSLDSPESESLTVKGLETAVELSCTSIMHWVQLLAREASASPPLWAVTKGAQPVEEKPDIVAVAQAPLWGFTQAIALEHPTLWGGAIDLDPESSVTEAAKTLCAALLQRDLEDRIAFRQGCRYVPRLRRQPSANKSAPALTWRRDSSYLITGGWGGIGLTVARAGVARGARHLILMGRTQFPSRESWDGLPPEHPLFAKIATIRELESMGAKIHLATVDVGDETQLADFLKSWEQQNLPPIRGVIHAAAQIEDKTLQQLDPESLKSVFRAKAIGSLLLHQNLKTTPLDFFVVFSSISSLLARYGQANYAAANAFLDALAYYRKNNNQSALSINWGVWTGLGVAVSEGGKRVTQDLSRLGMSEIQPHQGIKLLEELIQQDPVQAAVMPVNWSECRSFYLERPQPPLLEELLQWVDERSATPSSRRTTRLNRDALLQVAATERQQLLEDYLAEHLAKVLGIKPTQLNRQQPTNTLGLDSLMAIELKNQIETDFGTTIPMTDFYRGFSLAALTTKILDKLAVTYNLEESDIEEAERLLSGLDELSEEQVDGLLNALWEEQK